MAYNMLHIDYQLRGFSATMWPKTVDMVAISAFKHQMKHTQRLHKKTHQLLFIMSVNPFIYLNNTMQTDVILLYPLSIVNNIWLGVTGLALGL